MILLYNYSKSTDNYQSNPQRILNLKEISGKSEDVGVGLLSLMTKSQFTNLKDELGLDSKSVILCISTEGDTDESQYKRIVKDMKYPVPF